ncbi:SpoIIE family protein phosphatase [Salimicrobium flavidum]|uniref:Serine phosphatase n=1 Tax=Salimicrobium flavidum TaxID=570947 RepID=A0A1N7K4Q5_9BACI|nr:SpoIIE family protein phosphatase [Salimicrobium flavidum]SIS56583.1 serine phosphatase [Salimicrobium flavidum]
MNEPSLTIATYQKPKQGNFYCGDSYIYNETENNFICAMADGLGSGELAKEASKAVMDVIKQNPDDTIPSLVGKCNKVLMDKRGVVLGILRIDKLEGTYAYSSIGNIGIVIVDASGKKSRNIPLPGFLAGYPKDLRVKRGTLERGMRFLVFSDGVDERKVTKLFYRAKTVQDLVDEYDSEFGQSRSDDTTLVVMEYN